MPAGTCNEIFIAAPVETVWRLTNDLTRWTTLFTEYARVDILERDAARIVFRLTMFPDENGTTWSWVSERVLDEARFTVAAQRIETGPFEYMRIHWAYRSVPGGTVMTWRQDFAMKPSAPVDDEQMRVRIDTNSPIQMNHIKELIERTADRTSLAESALRGVEGTTVSLAGYAGRPLVLVLGNRATQKAGHRIVEQLRIHPDTADIPIVQVAHLRGVPRTLHRFAENDITSGRRRQVARSERLRAEHGLDTGHEDAAIGIVLDWEGALGQRFSFGSKDRSPVTVLLGPDSAVLAILRGDDPIDTLCTSLRSSAARAGATAEQE